MPHRNRWGGVLAAAIGLVLMAGPVLARTVTITIVQTNDIDRMEADKGRGGFAKLAAVVAAERAKGHVLFVHAGDTFSPSLLSGIDGGKHIVEILNRMRPDVLTPGNHEFDFGPDNFRARLAEAKFDVVTSNVREADGSQPRNTLDTKIVELDGVRIGFYGLTTETTPTVSSPGNLKFLATPETARRKAAELRAKGVDLVVAVVHTPLAVDLLLVRDQAADVILSGHDEHLLAFFDGKTALAESGAQAGHVVVTTLTIDKEERGGKTTFAWRPSFRIVDTADVEPNPEIAAAVKGYADRLDRELKVTIGKTETPLDSRRATVRSEEAAFGNLVADAIRKAVGADVAIINGGGIRADRQYAAGSAITRADIFAELPFGNRTVKLEVSGKQIKDALENGFSQVREGAGRFPQVSGLEVKADLAKLPGERVVGVFVGGVPLEPARSYTLATNDFLAGGGDGYRALVGAKRLIDAADAQLMASQVIDYVTAEKTIAPRVEGRIKLLGR